MEGHADRCVRCPEQGRPKKTYGHAHDAVEHEHHRPDDCGSTECEAPPTTSNQTEQDHGRDHRVPFAGELHDTDSTQSSTPSSSSRCANA
jgi:hypothetical protein